MKSERRHELEENVLAKEIEILGDRVKPYANGLLWALGVAVGLFAVFSWWNSSRAAKNAAAWEAYQLADLSDDTDRQEMYRLANSESYAGLEMQEWAFASWADRQLLRGSQLYLIDREDAQKRLESVLGVYQELAKSANNADIRSRAQLGVARTLEVQNRLDDAKAAYAKVQGSLSAIAKERLERLESGDVQAVSQWLAEVKLPEFKIAEESSGGDRPPFGVTPPSPDAPGAELNTSRSLDEILGSFEDNESGDSAPGAAEDQPAAAGEGPALGAPAAETPAAETPAAEAPTEASPAESAAEPADDVPADDVPASDDAAEAADSAAAEAEEQPAPPAAE